MDPAAWARVVDYWAQTNVTNETDPLEGYGQRTLRWRDFKTFKVGGELTGEIVSEVGRRIARYAPQIAFLDSTFLSKVAPLVHGDGLQVPTAVLDQHDWCRHRLLDRHCKEGGRPAALCSGPLVMCHSGPGQRAACLL